MSSGLSKASSLNAVRSTLNDAGSPAPHVTVTVSPTTTALPAPSAAFAADATADAIADRSKGVPSASVKSPSSPVPLTVIVTEAVLAPVSASPPLVIVNVPLSSAKTSSAIVADCGEAPSLLGSSDATVTANVTAASLSVMFSVAAEDPATSVAEPSVTV